MTFNTPPSLSGTDAEALALRFLEEQSLQLLRKNFSCKLGEVDLIMQDGISIVFVEVRFRKSNRFGSALESVTASKQRKLSVTAQYYLKNNQKGSAVTNQAARFDVIGISCEGSHSDTTYHGYQLDWCKNAF